MSREAARRAALMKFGGVAQAKEADREVRSFPMLERLWADVRDAVRGFRRTPASTSVVVLTLALGIGVTTAIFSVVYGVLLKPLPFNEPDRLVAVNHRMPGFGVPRNGPQSAATYFTYRDHARVFEDIGVWNTTEVSVTTRDTPERIRVLRVSDGLLPLLRVHPVLGTLIRKEDDVPGAPNRVVLTYRYWHDIFGAAADVLGQSLTIDAAPYEIIGVLPESFRFMETDAQVVLPLRLDRAQAFPGAGFGPHGVARLKPGVTLAQANDDIAATIPLIAEQFPLQPGVTRQMWESVGLAPDVRPLCRRGDRRCAIVPVDPPRLRGPRAARRVCERREPSACPRREPSAGVCDPSRTGGDWRSHRRCSHSRKPASGACRRSVRHAGGRGGAWLAATDSSRRTATRKRDRHRRCGADVHAGAFGGHRTDVRTASRVAVRQTQCQRVERRRSVDERSPWSAPRTQYARDRADCARPGVVDRLGPDGSHVHRLATCGPRLCTSRRGTDLSNLRCRLV